ncbi:MAG: HAMP domain-containing protein [Betaproteobacteria bacterium]|nr:HAMP domain-containing protein [Betaproteobacteria bacterium]
MGLRLKFNLILLAVFVAGFATIGMVALRYLENQAIDEARRAALVVLDAAGFSNLDPRIASGLGSRLVEMKIREFTATDELSGIEGQVAQKMSAANSSQMTEILTAPAGGRRLAVARTFHPAGSGGARIRLANIDLVPVLATANTALITLMSSIGAVFLAVFVVLNLMLDRMIVRPVAEMARQADAVSIGNFSIPEFAPKTRDEIGVLGIAFNRMRRSTEEAIKLLKGSNF